MGLLLGLATGDRNRGPTVMALYLAENKSLDRQVLEQLSRDEDENIAAKVVETLEHVLEKEKQDLEDIEDYEAGVLIELDQPVGGVKGVYPIGY